jgi:hypothetical protein
VLWRCPPPPGASASACALRACGGRRCAAHPQRRAQAPCTHTVCAGLCACWAVSMWCVCRAARCRAPCPLPSLARPVTFVECVWSHVTSSACLVAAREGACEHYRQAPPGVCVLRRTCGRLACTQHRHAHHMPVWHTLFNVVVVAVVCGRRYSPYIRARGRGFGWIRRRKVAAARVVLAESVFRVVVVACAEWHLRLCKVAPLSGCCACCTGVYPTQRTQTRGAPACMMPVLS